MKQITLLIILSLVTLNTWAFENAFKESNQLSDQEQIDALKYENTQRNQRITDEKCKQLNEKMMSGQGGVKIQGELTGCDDANVQNVGQVFGGGFGRTMEMMVPMVSKMYATVFGMPGMSKLTSKLNHTKELARQEKKGGGDLTSKYQATTEKGQQLKAGDTNLYKTDNANYYADSKGNMYQMENGKVSPCAAGNAECSKVKENYSKKKEKKEYEDWCSKVPMATEMVAGATQIFGEKKIEDNSLAQSNNLQYDGFSALAQTHKKRATTAQIQAGGWWATSACYIGYIAGVKGVASDWKVYAKLAASGFLGTFFQLKVKKHKEYAKEIESLMAELPKRGECNPHTDTICFCGESTSATQDPANYQRYCVPAVYQNHPNPETASSCVDKNMELDHKCSCKSTGSCLQNEMKNTGPIKFGLGNAFANSALDGVDALNRGDASLANSFANTNGNKLAAAMKKALNKLNPNSIPASAADPNMVRQIMESGIPKKLALKMASTPGNPLAASFSGSQFKGLDKKPTENSGLVVTDGKIKQSSRGFSTKKGRSRSSGRSFAFGGKKGSSSRAKGGVEFEGYSNQAAARAEISRDSSESIFQIISNRYSTSAWKKFDTYKLGAKASETE